MRNLPVPPQQHRFEGTDLEALLAEVRERFGDGAAIVEANRLRRGGIAGFFAREQFEVIVEVADAPAAPAPEVTDPAVDDAAAPVVRPGRSLLEWADAVSDGEQPGTAPVAPSVSTEGDRFADVLARMAHDTDAADEPADESLLDLSEPFEAWPEVKAVAEAATATGILDTAVERVPADPVAVRRAEATTRPARIDVRPLVAAGIPAELAVRGEAEADLPRAVLRALEHLPRPEPLPDLPGAVIAVVGERQAALELARRLAGELGLDPDDVLLASGRYHGSAVEAHRRVDTTDEAVERRRGLRRCPRPTVVAVDATAARRDGAWACRMLDSLEVTMTWATVEAARKPEDVRAWAELLGGVDVLAVTDLDQTVSPAAVLAAGVPVGRLDGVVASPAQWAAVLTDRLAA